MGNGGKPKERKRWQNLRDELRPVKHDPGLEDPRIPVWQDVLAARRQWLLHRKDGEIPKPPVEAQGPIDQLEMQALLYRQVRKEAFTTDGMGYGEVVEDELYWYGDGAKEINERRSQRTSSGRQTLSKPKKE